MLDKLIKVFLIVWLVGSILSFVSHFFYPVFVSELSFWSASVGWQREIALWNLGISFIIIIYLLMKNSHLEYGLMVRILIIIFLLLGLNYLLELIVNKEVMIINLWGNFKFGNGYLGLVYFNFNEKKQWGELG